MKTNKKILSLLLLSAVALTIAGCGSEKEDTEPKTEAEQIIDEFNNGTGSENISGQVFYIETLNQSGINNDVVLSKAGKLMGSSNITIASQTMGRVSAIRVKEWDQVQAGRILVSLSDTIGNYGIQVERAKVSLERAELNYQQSQVQLTQAVTDSLNALRQAENNYNITKEKIDQQVRQAEINLKNAQLSGGSSTSLEIEKLQTELDNQLQSLKNSFQTQKIQVSQLRDDILNQVDEILGITSLYKGTAKAREDLIGVRNTATKSASEQQFLAIKNKFNPDNLSNIPATDEELDQSILVVDEIYGQLNNLLNSLVAVIDSSFTGPGLSEAELAAFEWSVDALRITYQANFATFTSYANQVNNIFADKEKNSNGTNTTFQQQIDIIKKNAEIGLENSQLAYDQTLTQSKDSLFQVDLALKMAKENYQTATKNKDLQLSLLQNAIRDAQVAYADASKNYGKLQITTPINGYVQKVMVDKGQDMSTGTPAIQLAGTENNEIVVAADEDEIEYLSVGQEVSVTLRDNNYTGTIASIANVADTTLSYPVTIKIDEEIGQLGWSVSVKIPLQVSDAVLPLQAIELLGNDQGIVSLRREGQVESYQVELGAVRGNQVAVKTQLPSDADVILTNMTNYDPDKFTIQISQE